MPIPDDTTYGAQRGDVAYDQTTQAFYTRATGAWRIQPSVYQNLIVPLHSISAPNNLAPVRGIVYLQPFEVRQRGTLTKLTMPFVNVAGTVRFAIYQDTANTPVGGTKVWDSGNIGVGFTTGATVSYLATPGQYWLATTCSTSIGVNIYRSSSINVSWFVSATFSYQAGFAGALYTKSTSLPSSCPTVTLNVNTVNLVWGITII